jgi:ATP-dependent Lon protease
VSTGGETGDPTTITGPATAEATAHLPIVDGAYFILPGSVAAFTPKSNGIIPELVGVPKGQEIIVVPEALSEGAVSGVGVRAAFDTLVRVGNGVTMAQQWRGIERVSFTRDADGAVTWSPRADIVRPDLAKRVEAVKPAVLAVVGATDLRSELERQTTPEAFVNSMAALLVEPEAQAKVVTTDDPLERLEVALDAIEKQISDDPLQSVIWKLARQPLSDDARKVVDTEIASVRNLEEKDQTRAAGINYLKKVADLPWGTHAAPPQQGLSAISATLDSRHTGLPEVKEAVLIWAAKMLMVEFRNSTLPADQQQPLPHLKPILVVGPPGTGKTTLVKSIAESLNRELIKIEVGSVASSGGFNGFERTWSNSEQGELMKKVARAGTVNAVLLLNEIDKLQSGGQNGNPSAPLMELTDPSQSVSFTDRHFGFGFDLSPMIIVATANNLESIDPVLRNRFEVINAPGYGPAEKVQIATDHVIPNILRSLQVPEPADITVTPEAIKVVVDDYTSEAGVRQLETQFEKILGRAVRDQVQELGLKEAAGDTAAPAAPASVLVDPAFVRNSLGEPKRMADPPIVGPPGFGTAMYVNDSAGTGGIMAFQVRTFKEGRGRITTTGVAGTPEPGKAENGIIATIKVARDFVRDHAEELGVEDARIEKRDIHMHFDAMAQLKDGPSAGVAIAMTLTSSLWGESMPEGWTMTGEISMDGRVLPIGGVNEKILAAHRLGIHNVLIPQENARDLKLPEDVASEMNVHPITTLQQAYGFLFPHRGVQVDSSVVRPADAGLSIVQEVA